MKRNTVALVAFYHLLRVNRKISLLRKAGFKVEAIRTWGGIAAGLAPRPIKSVIDRLAKAFGFGDVMILRAAKADDRSVA